MWIGLGVIYQRLFNFQDYMESKFILTVNAKLQKMWKKAVTAYLKYDLTDW
jgi:hypothetical protein